MLLLSRHHKEEDPLHNLLQRCPPRYRWYFAIIVLLVGYLLFQPIFTTYYFARLPAPKLLSCAMEAVAEGRYDDGECYLLHARRKAPQWEMMDIALHVFYWHEGHDYPLALRRYEWLAGVPVLNRWLAPHELAWRDAREDRALDWLQRNMWPAEGCLTLGAAGKLFDECWSASPHEVESMTSALLALQRSDFARAWTLFAALEMNHPKIFTKFRHVTPLLLRNYALAARRSGHSSDADRLTALYRQQPAFRLDSYNEANIRGHEVVDPARDIF